MLGFRGALSDSTALLWLRESAWCIIPGILFSAPLFKRIAEKKAFALLSPILYLLLFVLSVSYLIKGGYNPFIYFNF